MALSVRGLTCLVVNFILTLFLAGTSLAVSANDGFDPNANDVVSTSAVQRDGKIVVAGAFTSIGGQARTRLARLNPDGSADQGFSPAVDNYVYSIALQDDGKIVIGGAFTTVGGLTRNNIARLNSDGSVDTGFDPGTDNTVGAVLPLPGGKLLIAGSFTTVGQAAQAGIARLLPDGTVDPSFHPSISGSINAASLQADGKVVMVGSFTPAAGAPLPSQIARLNPDGSFDSSFTPPSTQDPVSDVALQPDGKILIGGWFSSYDAQGNLTRSRLARLNPDGSLDTSFGATPNQSVDEVMVQPDGKILLWGSFTAVSGVAANHIARLKADGTVDTTFSVNPDNGIGSATLQPDGSIIIGGSFTAVGGVGRNHIARLRPDGTLDRTISLNLASGPVRSIVFQPDGSTLVGGGFTVGGTPYMLVRVNGDGAIDSSFKPGLNNTVYCSFTQEDGRIVVGGYFTQANFQPKPYLVRLNQDGTLDSSFNPSVNQPVYTCNQQQGKVLIGGSFTAVNGSSRRYIARLNADGTLDSAFNDPAPNASVKTLLTQPDGKIVIGGDFTTLGPQATGRRHIARLNADGTLDASFDPDVNSTVSTLVLQADGRILIGGSFSTVGGQPRNDLARIDASGGLDAGFTPEPNGAVDSLALQADGRIVMSGAFTSVAGVTRNRVARLNADGSVDASFDPNANDRVWSVAVEGDGKVAIGGWFTSVGGVSRSVFARLSNTESASQSLAVSSDRSAVTWLRGGTAPELYDVAFLSSSDGVNWTLLGSGVRTGGGWQLTGLSLPSGQNLYIRAKGVTRDGSGNASSSIIESTSLVYLPPAAPVATAATAVTGNGFTANWSASAGATSYRLDVASDSDFTNYATGYQNLDVGNVTSFAVSGLAPATAYSYRVRAYNGGSVSDNSNTAIQPTEDWNILAIAKAGNGAGTVSSSPSGISCGDVCSSAFMVNTTVTLSASPVTGALFEGWSGACSGTGACTVSLATPASATASFRDVTAPSTSPWAGSGQYNFEPLISFTCEDTGGSGCSQTLYCLGTGCTPDTIFSGEERHITNSVDLRFSSKDAAGNAEEIKTASYTIVHDYPLTVTNEGTGNGVVSGGGINCSYGNAGTCDSIFQEGSWVTLTATPTAPSGFGGWGGACAGVTDQTCMVLMDSVKTVSATFISYGPAPEVLASGNLGPGSVSMNALGEAVWSQYDPETSHYQIFSSQRGRLTSAPSDQKDPAINSVGDVAWISDEFFLNKVQGLFGGKLATLATTQNTIQKLDMTDKGEVIWTEYNGTTNQIISSVRGGLTGRDTDSTLGGIRNNGDIVFLQSDPALPEPPRVFLLPAGSMTPVPLDVPAAYPYDLSINDLGEIAWTAYDPATSLTQIVSQQRGALVTAPQLQRVDLNACGDLIYTQYTQDGVALYRLGHASPCGSYPDANRTREQASPIAFGDVLTGRIDSAIAPEGWYRFDASAGDAIHITVNYDNGTTHVIEAALFDGQGNPVAGPAMGAPVKLELSAPYTGSYFLRVAGAGERVGYSVSLGRYGNSCGNGPCPELLASGDLGFGVSVNALGEAVWAQFDPASGYQIFSSQRGQITNDPTEHRNPAINSLGDLVWTSSDYYYGTGSMVQGIIGGKAVTLASTQNGIRKVDINDHGEVVWSEENGPGHSRIISNVRGALTAGDKNSTNPSINNKGDVLFLQDDPAQPGPPQVFMLAAGATTPVPVTADVFPHFNAAVNDGGEALWTQGNDRSPAAQIVSSLRGGLTAGQVQDIDINNCGDVVYTLYSAGGREVYRLGNGLPCGALPGKHGTAEQAAPIALGDVVTGQLDSAAEPVSWYRFDATAGEAIHITINYRNITPGDLEAGVYDPQGNLLVAATPGAPVLLSLAAPYSGSYFLKITGKVGRIGYSVSLSRYQTSCGAGPCPELVTSGDLGWGMSINSLGEAVWTQYDWETAQYQIFSSQRGRLTSEPLDHRYPAINDLGDLVWSSPNINGSTNLQGIFGGRRVTVAATQSFVTKVDLSNKGEVIWSEFNGSTTQIFSNQRGALTSRELDSRYGGINNNGDVVFLQSDPALPGPPQLFTLPAGSKSPVPVNTASLPSIDVTINDRGEIVWIEQNGQDPSRLVSSRRGALLAYPKLQSVDMNGCGDMIFIAYGMQAPELYRVGSASPCALPGAAGTIEQAAPVVLGEVFTGVVDSVTAPVSWYRFDASAGDSIRVTVNYDTRPPNLIEVGLYDGQGMPLAAPATAGAPVTLDLAAPYSGSYFLKVTGVSGRIGFGASVAKNSGGCGNGPCPEQITGNDAGWGVSINSLGEVAWVAKDPATARSQIFSSLRGQLTSDDADHYAVAINNTGDVVWVESTSQGYMVRGMIGGKAVTVATNIEPIYKADINDRGEVVWSQYDGPYTRIHSSVRGVLTTGDYSAMDVSINNQGDVVFSLYDPAGTTPQQVYKLAAGSATPVPVSQGVMLGSEPALNDGGEVIWTQVNEATSLRELFSTVRGVLLSGSAVDSLDINNCGDVVYAAPVAGGEAVFRLGSGAPCVSYPGTHATLQEAAPVTVGDTFTALADSASVPVSWYSIPAAAGDVLHIRVNYDGRAPNNLVIGLYDAFGNQVAAQTAPGQLDYTVPVGGVYYLKMEAISGRFGYAVTVQRGLPAALKLVVEGQQEGYFTSLAEAFSFESPATDLKLFCRSGDFAEDLNISQCGKTVTMNGGYDPGFTTPSGKTRINGKIKLTCGKLVLDAITLR